MSDGKLRVVTDEGGRRWVQAADVPEVSKLPLPALRKVCPDVAHFELDGRPVRWLPVERLPTILVPRGVTLEEACRRQATLAEAPLVAAGLRRQGMAKAGGAASEVVVAQPEATVVEAPVVEFVDPRVAPPPLVLNGDGATVTFEGHTIPVHLFRGRLCVIATDLGHALGYADDGKGLTESVRGWSEMTESPLGWHEGMAPGPGDYAVLRGDNLRGFKALCSVSAEAAGSKTHRLMVLFETGMDLACQKAQTPAGERLRRYLADEVLPKLRRGQPVQSVVPVSPPPAGVIPPAPPAAFDEERFARVVAVAVAAAFPQMLATAVQVLRPFLALPAAPQAIAPAVPGPVYQAAPAAPPPPATVPPPPPPTMLIPRDWRSAEVIAALLTERRGHRVSRKRVDGAIAALKVRERPEVARHGMTPRTDGGGVHYEVPFWRYAPAVLDDIDRHLYPHPPAQQTIPEAR